MKKNIPVLGLSALILSALALPQSADAARLGSGRTVIPSGYGHNYVSSLAAQANAAHNATIRQVQSNIANQRKPM